MKKNNLRFVSEWLRENKMLCALSENGEKEKVREVNMTDNNGFTALMNVCANNPPKEVVELLLNRGAEVNMKDKYGQTALMYALGVIHQKKW
ncbi:MAG: ankyrin repeat domain-containing protein [Clostridiales bacterium]|nr:ankyrin repeat domain-containing protein [Clostridiales bacterium]